MPLPLLIAMVLAFGLNLPTEARPLPRAELAFRLTETVGGVLLIGVLAFILGETAASRAHRTGRFFSSRALFAWSYRALVGLGLAVFAWTLCVADWRRVVDWGFGLRRMMIVEELALLLPYLAGQIVTWCGVYRAERVLRPSVSTRGLPRFLARKARHSLGMVLPVALIYILGRDLLRWGFPRQWDDPNVQMAGMAAIGALIFLLSPAFVRLTWPTRRLEPGPLRDRLDHLARRLNFRCADILVWDTDGQIVNAGVTGTIPWFRYVLITDAMIELLDEHEIEAVFGHEVGHVAHRHLLYFGLFFLGSTGVMALFTAAVERYFPLDSHLGPYLPNAATTNMVEEGIYFAFFGLYFLVIFGLLSRRFERQADVYGSRSVSCGSHDCPPHPDLNSPENSLQPIRDLCPVGIRIFANALSHVAELNGMAPEARSWRHGSIARRVRFLNTLEGDPENERRFQKGLVRFRWALGLILLLASAAAVLLSRSTTR